MTSQYEANLWLTHVKIVWLAKPIRHCVRWRMQVFKIEGFVCKRLLPSPPLPLPPLSFFGSCFISRSVKTENPLLCLSLLRNLTETLATQANCPPLLVIGGGGGGDMILLAYLHLPTKCQKYIQLSCKWLPLEISRKWAQTELTNIIKCNLTSLVFYYY